LRKVRRSQRSRRLASLVEPVEVLGGAPAYTVHCMVRLRRSTVLMQQRHLQDTLEVIHDGGITTLHTLIGAVYFLLQRLYSGIGSGGSLRAEGLNAFLHRGNLRHLRRALQHAVLHAAQSSLRPPPHRPLLEELRAHVHHLIRQAPKIYRLVEVLTSLPHISYQTG
jgi:hypothetical protein